MKITKNTVVTVKYKLSDAQGNVLEETDQPMVYLHGDYDNILPKIEEALNGKDVNYKTEIQIEPKDAFGDYDANLIRVEPRDRFPDKLEAGMQFEGIPDDDEEGDESMLFTVTDIANDKVVLDANHPLAGIALRFSLHVVEVRAATKEEIQHQHVHDSYGCFEDDEDEDSDYRTRVLH